MDFWCEKNFIEIINLIFISFNCSFNILHNSISLPNSNSSLNKSRQLFLSQYKLNSFLPTVRPNNSMIRFKGFTFIVQKKKSNNEIQNIFLHDNWMSKIEKFISKCFKLISSTTIVIETVLDL